MTRYSRKAHRQQQAAVAIAVGRSVAGPPSWQIRLPTSLRDL